jgi:AAA family ATP:ADP antiporter
VQVLLNRLFKVEPGEWPKLLQFGLFGLLLQTGMGVGFAAGDAAFLTHVGADKLPVIFLLTPVVMLVYTAVFSYLLVRFSIDRVVEATLGLLIAGGAILWALIEVGLPKPWDTTLYYALKLYLAMWYIGLYTLFWNFTDTYFDIQDAKRLFPLFAAFCALGTTLGALIVSLFANVLPMHAFMLVWASVAVATAPVALLLRRRWRRIADTDTDLDGESTDVRTQALRVARTFRTSPYAVALVLTLFVTLLMTNLAEFQYSTVLQKDRSEAELAGLFGRLYAATNVFNLVVCLLVFNRLVTRVGVRNVALVLPLTYFAVFAYFFMAGGELAAFAAFFAYHGVLTSIEYNNQNLLFNATPSAVKRPFRTVVEGLAEPLASLLAGGFLLLAAKHSDMRELSGIGVMLGAVLVGVVMALRHYYPGAMEANMRRGWLNFGDPDIATPAFDAQAAEALKGKAAEPDSGTAAAARWLLHAHATKPPAHPAAEEEESEATKAFAAKLADPSPSVRKYALQALVSVVGPGDIGLVRPLVENLPVMDRTSRRTILELLAAIGDVEAIPQILAAAAQLSPRELRATEAVLVGFGEAAIPRLMQALRNYQTPYRARSMAARALSTLSHAQFMSQLDRLVREELGETGPRLAVAQRFEAEARRSPAMSLLAHAYRQRIGESVDFTLELLALGGLLPDFDLLIVSLHSANPKVRGNAIEAIAAGVDHATWRKLEPLLNRRAVAAGGAGGELAALLKEVVDTTHGFEAAAAAQALRDLVPEAELAAHLRGAIEPGLSDIFRDSYARLLGLPGAERPTVVDLVAAIRERPEFAAASIDAQVALAERVTSEPAARKPVELSADGRSWWLSRPDIDEVAARYPDLALAMLKVQDGRAYAA